MKNETNKTKVFYAGTLLEGNYCGKVFTEDYRRGVVDAALELKSISTAAKLSGHAESSVWRWMLAQDRMRDYKRKKTRANDYTLSPFTRSPYSDQFRLAAVQRAIREGASATAKALGVSEGSVNNWTKAYSSAGAYLNRNV